MSERTERVERLRGINRLDDAEREARAGLVDDPSNAELLTALAAVLLNARRYHEGLAAADAATAAAPDLERAHRVRALLLSGLGWHQHALDAAHRSVTLTPEEALAALGYAQVLQAAGRLADARQVAERAVRLDPHLAGAQLRLADICEDLGDRSAARRAYEETLRLDPENAVARHDLALLDAKTHRLSRALRGLVDAGTLDPTMPIVLNTVTTVLWQLSWRLRIWLIAATVFTFMTSADASGWATRAVAGGVLLASAALAWWTTRDLPKATRTVVLAALRTDAPLWLTYLALSGCILIYLLIVVTGLGGLAGLVWVILLGLAVLALIIRVARR